MKPLFVVSTFCLALLSIISCKKPANTPPGNAAVSIDGKWNIVSDSTWFVYTLPQTKATGHLYIGQPGDFYNFASNGSLSAVEGTYSNDTLLYKYANDTLKISWIYTNPDYSPKTSTDFVVNTFTGHKLVITAIPAYGLLPDGYSEEMMVFSR
jgi:hypothetical protein